MLIQLYIHGCELMISVGVAEAVGSGLNDCRIVILDRMIWFSELQTGSWGFDICQYHEMSYIVRIREYHAHQTLKIIVAETSDSKSKRPAHKP